MGNEVGNNSVGIHTFIAENNLIVSNNIENNTVQARVQSVTDWQGNAINGFDNKWDNGTCGNYWSDYTAKNPNAVKVGNTWNAPYVIDNQTRDNNPLLRPVAIQQPCIEVTEPEPPKGGEVSLVLVLAPIAAIVVLGLVGYAFFVRKNRAN